MKKRKKHTHKVIEKAVLYAEQNGWLLKETGGSAHAWARLLCPLHSRIGCSMSVWSTPKNAESHAKQIRRRVDVCIHSNEESLR